MRRIARGIRKFVTEADDPFIVPVTHPGDVRVHGLHEPFRTITGANRGELALISPHVTKFRTGATGSAVDAPLHTITAGPKDDPAGAAHAMGLVEAKLAPFLTEHANASGQRVFNAAEPLRTQCGEVKGGHFAEVCAFLAKHYGGHETPGAKVIAPADTITAQDHHALVAAHVVRHFGKSVGSQAKPSPSVPSAPAAWGRRDCNVAPFEALRHDDRPRCSRADSHDHGWGQSHC
jgi:DNA (cytosine-5)-methyltransferase 1